MKLRKLALRTAKSKAVRTGTKMTLAPKDSSFLSFIRGNSFTANYALLSFWNSPALFFSFLLLIYLLTSLFSTLSQYTHSPCLPSAQPAIANPHQQASMT